jgi:hypothetical protein
LPLRWRLLLPPTLMLPVTVVTIGIALTVMLPVAIRFGAAGVIGLLVVVQLLGVVVLASALFGIPAARASGREELPLRQPDPRPSGRSRSAVMVAAVLALNYASFRLSSWLYRRREF